MIVLRKACVAILGVSICVAVATQLRLTDAAKAQGTSGADLVSWCAGFPDSSRPRTCELYVSEIVGLIGRGEVFQGHRACIPPGVTIAQVIAISVEWLLRNPEDQKLAVGVAITRSLEPVYPC